VFSILPDRRPDLGATRKRLVWPNWCGGDVFITRDDARRAARAEFDCGVGRRVGEMEREAEETWDSCSFALRSAMTSRGLRDTDTRNVGVPKGRMLGRQ